MAFVNIRGFMVDEAERKKYNDLYTKAGGKGGLGCEDWTIDRGREMLLVCLYIEREDMYEGNFHLSEWVFYWHGEWVSFFQNDYGKEVSENHWQKTRIIKKMALPASVANKAEEFFTI